MTDQIRSRPSQYMTVLLWLLLVVIYGWITELPAVERPLLSGVDNGASNTGALDTPLDRLRSSMHILIADRGRDEVRLKEMIVREGAVTLTPEEYALLSGQPQASVGRQIGQFFQNRTLPSLYLDLAPRTEVNISEYRKWSVRALVGALIALIGGFLWMIAVQTLAERKVIDKDAEARVWRWSTLIAILVVTGIHSVMVYYQGGLLVSPVGLVASAILPLLAVQAVILWEGWSKSWPLLLPMAGLVIGHWWAQMQAMQLGDPATTAFLSHLFSSTYLYQLVYLCGVILGILSIGSRRPTPASRLEAGIDP